MTKGSNLIAIRYARSLLTDAGEGEDHGKQGRYQSVFEALRKLFAIREAVEILKSPTMPIDLKKNLLELALDEGSADAPFRAFISYLLDVKRVTLIPQIAKAYDDIIADQRNEKRTKVISARRLPEDLMAKIEENLRNLFGKKILVNNEIDSSLLGGFIIEVGNFLFDCSLRSMVDKAIK